MSNNNTQGFPEPHSGSSARRRLRVIIIGAGMAGVLSGIKLRDAGEHDFVIYEKSNAIGGTWRENTYPGLACDVPSHVYTYSFEPNPDWTSYYPPGPEIRAYFERTARKYGVLDHIRFGEEVRSCHFVEGRWRIRTSGGIADEADVVIAATGVLHHISYPDIAGLDSFAGAMFHSARWDHAQLLSGKRIGIIGNGSTGVQLVSALSKLDCKVTLFQRTPQWIIPIENTAFTEADRARLRGDRTELLALQRNPEYWQLIINYTRGITEPDSPYMLQIQALCLANLEDNVSDPVLREKLRPNYRAGCKRIVYSTDFYQAIQRPNVTLVTERIDRVEPAGVRTAQGELHELDVLVPATGFKADSFLMPMDVRGIGGLELRHYWRERPRAYLSIAMPQFPNLFLLNGPNGPVGNFSLIDIAEHQWNYISQLIRKVGEQAGGAAITVDDRAMEDFERERIAAAKRTVWATGCHSWYLDAQGVPASWPWDRERFLREMNAPDMRAFTMIEPTRKS
jgi:cation diffusion facilitator CzcD-associated flavoprotein CzcO